MYSCHTPLLRDGLQDVTSLVESIGRPLDSPVCILRIGIGHKVSLSILFRKCLWLMLPEQVVLIHRNLSDKHDEHSVKGLEVMTVWFQLDITAGDIQVSKELHRFTVSVLL